MSILPNSPPIQVEFGELWQDLQPDSEASRRLCTGLTRFMVGSPAREFPPALAKPVSQAVCVQAEKDLAKGGRVQRSEKAPGICSGGSRSRPLCRLTSRALVRPHSLCPAPHCPLTVTSAPVSGLTEASDGSRRFPSPLPLTKANSAAADALCN